ncbi:unnamed protein product [Ostreobium quekettii]|uniref:MaoC-like domain-containing protein n=1 Tax=Ostreobium quekettii TaxID=121088 RepID=A0A8S1JC81_9CHLO|nr:unnamed protein product [Ostreobium quekettii]|eukprot:evm.model.scf_189EXC.2 EVM.evm.TU.scf_189EXC.2   scf_189EXC:17782-21743(-)
MNPLFLLLLLAPLAVVALVGRSPRRLRVHLRAWPSIAVLYIRAASGMLLKPGRLPATVTRVAPIEVSVGVASEVDGQRLANFQRLVQGPNHPQHVPIMYFIVEAFRLAMAVLFHPAFPVSVAGAVLARYTLVLTRNVQVHEKLLHSCSVDTTVRHTDKGDIEFDLISTATTAAAGDVVWRSTLTILLINPKRVKAAKPAAGASKGVGVKISGELIDTWHLGGDAGRRYASLNGDYNPIHLFPITAKLFGFRRPIAHALFLLARAVSAIETKHGLDMKGGWEMESEFKRPTLLPATLGCYVGPKKEGAEGAIDFSIGTEDGLKEVLTGTLKRLG